jgi:hypothetical protein
MEYTPDQTTLVTSLANVVNTSFASLFDALRGGIFDPSRLSSV